MPISNRGAFFSALAFALSLAVTASLAQPVPRYVSLCKVDAEISDADRKPVEAAALAVAQAMLKGDGDAVFRGMTKAAQSSAKPTDLAQYASFAARSGPYQAVQVAHTYQIDVKGGRDPLPKMICGRSLTDPDAVALSMAAIPRQFHVEIKAHTINNDWSMFLWLVPEQGELKVLALNLNASAISGRTAPDLHKLAVAQSARGHAVNAALLYRAAEGVAGRGPNAAPMWKRDLDRDASGLRLPPEFRTGSAGGWRFEGEAFGANDVGVLGVGGDLDIMIVRHPHPWTDTASIDVDNRAFVTGLLRSHPELADGFGAIVVRAMKPDGSGGFGTVYVFGKGFSAGPAA